MSSKAVITFGMTAGMTVGGFAPYLFGDHSLLDAWGLLGGLVGGIIGIWLGVKVSKQIG